MTHQPRKRLGQHFLHDPGTIERILRTLAPRSGERVVEIGPGTGALTAALLERVEHLDAVELDRALIAELRARWPAKRLTLHEADALKLDFAALAGQTPLRVTGNLPYNISTPLIFHLLETPAVIHDMHFMLQREVVNRLAAAPGTKERGRLSVMVQYHCRVDALFTVPPGAFTPPPKVTSAVVRLVPFDERPHLADDDEILTGLVRQAFSQRRKAIRNSLKSRLSAARISAAGVEPGQRPEQLAVADFVALANVQSRS